MTTVHVVGLPHTTATVDWSTCAYSGKIRRLGGMLTSTGHRAILYGGERADGEWTEHVPAWGEAERRRWFGAETWRERVFDRWNSEDPAWTESCGHAIREIQQRIEPGDVVGIIAGRCQAPLAFAFPGHTTWEWGVGYTGVLPKTFRTFESRAWAAHVAGRERDDGFRAFDSVVPNSWDPDELHYGTGHGGYLLFIGRVIRRKGPHIAAEAAKAAGMRLLVAGQGVAEAIPGRIVATDGTVLTGDVEYVGVLGPDERDRIMGDAIATFVPTQYLEPFGGVAVESMLTGTPAIATDWGAFPETIAHLRSGFLCRTLADFVAAARTAPELDRREVRAWAAERYLTTGVRWQYADVLARLGSLAGAGWYALAAA